MERVARVKRMLKAIAEWCRWHFKQKRLVNSILKIDKTDFPL